MAQGQTIVIRKKKRGGGHGGHHGGAWKVAYADFVTAMMCFFLVMWLMGADEEIKEAISHYFNHPETPFNAGRDPSSSEVHPLGENTGPGESLLNGREGQMPEAMVDQLSRPMASLTEHRKLSEVVRELLEERAYAVDANIDHLTFAVSEADLFSGPTSVALTERGKKALDRLGKVFQGYSGQIRVEGHVNFDFKLGRTSPYEFSLSRAVNVMNYLVENNYVPAGRIVPRGSASERAIASEKSPIAKTANARIEFTMTRVNSNP